MNMARTIGFTVLVCSSATVWGSEAREAADAQVSVKTSQTVTVHSGGKTHKGMVRESSKGVVAILSLSSGKFQGLEVVCSRNGQAVMFSEKSKNRSKYKGTTNRMKSMRRIPYRYETMASFGCPWLGTFTAAKGGLPQGVSADMLPANFVLWDYTPQPGTAGSAFGSILVASVKTEACAKPFFALYHACAQGKCQTSITKEVYDVGGISCRPKKGIVSLYTEKQSRTYEFQEVQFGEPVQ